MSNGAAPIGLTPRCRYRKVGSADAAPIRPGKPQNRRDDGADQHLRRLVRDLHSDVGGTTTLATPHGLFMQIIDTAGTTGTDDFAERGLRISMFGTAIGDGR